MHADPAVSPAPTDDFFLARQPILGRDQRLVAFELLFRAAGEHDDARLTNGAAATAAVIAHASQLGMQQVVGDQLAFVNADEDVLMSDFVRFLPADKVILEILETVQPSERLLARVAELKALGFSFALDDVVAHSDEVAQLLALVDVVKVDVRGTERAALAQLTESFRHAHKKLLAEKVETREEFQYCLSLGFDYFQGYYFARPVTLSGKKIAPSEMAILRLLELLDGGADNAALERAVKRDALVSLNLLRLVNSRAAGPLRRIESVSQALEQLGRGQLRRWLQILLYSAGEGAVELRAPLLQLASTRGKLMELMAQRLHPRAPAEAERAFTVGVLSLADALFGARMAEILDRIDVPDAVRAALLAREGELGAMLQVAERLEGVHCGQEMQALLARLGLSVKQMRAIELAAFEWVNELAHLAH